MRQRNRCVLDFTGRGLITELTARVLSCAILFLVLWFFLSSSAVADPIRVVVDTTSISGTSGSLAFDFIDGDLASNTTTISGFITDGTLGSNFPTGDVSGTLPQTVTIGDTSFFNEYFQDFTFGNEVSFVLDLTRNSSPGALFPDSFSFFLLDSSGFFPLFPTTDPTFADALFAIDIDGSPTGRIMSFSGTGTGVSWSVTPVPVPEPSSLLLLTLGLLARGILRKRQRLTP